MAGRQLTRRIGSQCAAARPQCPYTTIYLHLACRFGFQFRWPVTAAGLVPPRGSCAPCRPFAFALPRAPLCSCPPRPLRRRPPPPLPRPLLRSRPGERPRPGPARSSTNSSNFRRRASSSHREWLLGRARLPASSWPSFFSWCLSRLESPDAPQPCRLRLSFGFP